MISITVFRKDHKITAFELSGHAESGPYGYDLVCAGVSAISFGTVNAIMQICEINLEINQEENGGYLYVAFPASIDDNTKEKSQLLLEGMIISLQTIEREYHQFIKIENK
ncbi:ribosomal-processing cysteine protease Prp [Virgibacillus alimentarius]|uniref:Ribosomal processing cysteine protease Prp n=1 Tax=Virgibacillus alimentarius TaxID=698769 RepID=A0ABS4S6F1_9BACI|nr:ribosomal-processing cysteine protease Prp [Virgibacillus alimentarius]MBP2256636.1 uncharacterized protein YsxB (DUF464 family) [Virgibacillus alimentarius]